LTSPRSGLEGLDSVAVYIAQMSSDLTQQQTDEATLQQMEDISNDIAANQPLVDITRKVSEALGEVYADAPGFLSGVMFLNGKYSCMRRVRGDGNCFYR
jgi:hypothetical protein